MNLPLPAASPGPVLPAPRDDLCLDFANTRFWRGSEPPTETLTTPQSLLDWLETAIGADPRVVAALRQRWSDDPETARQALEAALRLREAIYAVFASVSDGTAPTPDALAALNAALDEAPARIQLDNSTGRFAWRVPATSAIRALLAPLLWSAGDLLTGPRLGRVRRCANERCRWVFLDDSKSANRRWCSMSACGNRAKAHRHYMRHKKA